MASEREQAAQDPQARTAPSNDPRDTLRLFPPPFDGGSTGGSAETTRLSRVGGHDAESPRLGAARPAPELQSLVNEPVAADAEVKLLTQSVAADATRGESDVRTISASETGRAALAKEELNATQPEGFDERLWMNSYRPQSNYGTHETELAEPVVHRGQRRRKPAVVAFAATAMLVCAIGVGAARRMTPLTGRSVSRYPATALTSLPIVAATPLPALAPAESSEQVRPPQDATDSIPSALPDVKLNAPASRAVARQSVTPEIPSPTNPIKTSPRSAGIGNERPHSGQAAGHPIREAEPATRTRTEPVHGIKVSDVYINERGELVDAQGRSLSNQ